MKINRNNYESYFTDYLDGRLTAGEKSELQAFLLVNDDLRELLEDLETVKLKAPEIHYPHKFLLKQEENLRLQPDLSIHYPYKSRLYRHNHRLIILRVAAAMVLLCIGISYVLHRQQIVSSTTTHTPMVYVTPPEAVEEMPTAVPAPIVKVAKAVRPRPMQKKPTAERELLAVMDILPAAPTFVPAPKVDYALSTGKRADIFVTVPEIYLAESAVEWKSSERNILSDNIFNSMITAGKIIAGRMKNKEEN